MFSECEQNSEKTKFHVKFEITELQHAVERAVYIKIEECVVFCKTVLKLSFVVVYTVSFPLFPVLILRSIVSYLDDYVELNY